MPIPAESWAKFGAIAGIAGAIVTYIGVAAPLHWIPFSGHSIASAPPYNSRGAVPLKPGTLVSIRATTACCTDDYIAHDDGDDEIHIQPVSEGSSPALRADATWRVVPGLANSDPRLAKMSCVSFESTDQPGKYMRHFNYQLHLATPDGTAPFTHDATFCPQPGNSGHSSSLQSSNYPDDYIRHFGGAVYIANNGGPNPWDNSNLWPDDTTWVATPPWS